MHSNNIYQDVVHPLILDLRRGVDDILDTRENFFPFVERNIDELCERCTTRQLMSIIDTYVDHAYPYNLRSTALSVSVLFNTLKLSDTLYFCL